MSFPMMANWRRAGAILFALLIALGAFALGCGDDDDDNDNPMNPIDEGPFRRTPEELLADFFETAYTTRDSALYAEMLCENFQFEFLQADADSLCGLRFPPDICWWGRTIDLRSTGNLFRSEEVTGITLNIRIDDKNAYLGDDCIGCYQLETTITLRVATIGDGTEPLIFTVDSPQSFVTKPDPADSTLWCLYRQLDRPRSIAERNATIPATATEGTTWGRLKGLFR
ncbi:MAG: hypothetical protein ACKVU1_15415 [bacterium]